MPLTLKNRINKYRFFKASRKKQLVNAIDSGDIRLIEALIKDGTDVNFILNINATRSYSRNPEPLDSILIYACKSRNLYVDEPKRMEIMKMLIKAGANVNYVNNYGESVLTILIANAKSKTPIIVELVEFLIQNGANVNQQTKDGYTPLLRSCIESDITVVNILIKAGANLNNENDIGLTPLIYAVTWKKNDIVDILLKSGADINYRNKYGNTILIHTVMENRESMVPFLIQNGANLNIEDIHGDTALIKSCMRGNTVIIDMLLKAGADINYKNKNGNTALLYMCAYSTDETRPIIQVLIKAGANLNDTNTEGKNTLILASISRKDDICQFLISEGVNVNHEDNQGSTALTISCMKGKIEIIDMLLKAGADVNHEDASGNTPLTLSTFSEYESTRKKILKILLDADADVNHINKNSESILEYFISKSDISSIRDLINSRANLNYVNKDGNTPLIYACSLNYRYERDQIIKLLIKPDTNFKKKNNKGNTALDEYKKNRGNNPDIIEILSSNKSNKTKWLGFTKEDMNKLNDIFDREKAPNLSLCPVCLSITNREGGCMYMSHNCRDITPYYDNELYELYSYNQDGKKIIQWCTSCGRIANHHVHYKLSVSNDKTPQLNQRYDVFGDDCLDKGGGGLAEKLSRFAEYRNIIISLKDKVGKILRKDAYKLLIRAVWDAPFNIPFPPEHKTKPEWWNQQTTEFPNTAIVNHNNNSNIDEIAAPSYLKPATYAEGKDMFNDPATLITFNHKQRDGTYVTHANSVDDFNQYISAMNKSFQVSESFGYCILYNNGCTGCLHPEEVKQISETVPGFQKDLYEPYKRAFNKFFSGKESPCPPETPTGGGNNGPEDLEDSEDFIKDANALCSIPTKGGKKTRSNKRRYRFTKKRRNY